jgi:hypothetical protein
VIAYKKEKKAHLIELMEKQKTKLEAEIKKEKNNL